MFLGTFVCAFARLYVEVRAYPHKSRAKVHLDRLVRAAKAHVRFTRDV